MSWWSEATKPLNKALDSNVFKAVFPVQALAQKAVSLGSGLTGLNHGQGLRPMDQYGIGAGVGSLAAGGSALMGGGGGAGGAGGASGAGGESSAISKYLMAMRQGGAPQQQQAPQQTQLEQIYQMYPNLRPQWGGIKNGF